jgi:hypothetical protein
VYCLLEVKNTFKNCLENGLIQFGTINLEIAFELDLFCFQKLKLLFSLLFTSQLIKIKLVQQKLSEFKVKSFKNFIRSHGTSQLKLINRSSTRCRFKVKSRTLPLEPSQVGSRGNTWLSNRAVILQRIWHPSWNKWPPKCVAIGI